MSTEPFTPPDKHDLEAAVRVLLREVGDAVDRRRWSRAHSLLKSLRTGLLALEQVHGKRAVRVGGTP